MFYPTFHYIGAGKTVLLLGADSQIRVVAGLSGSCGLDDSDFPRAELAGDLDLFHATAKLQEPSP